MDKTVSAEKRGSLHDLLATVVEVHKKDINDYTWGHLNEANLPKIGWKSSHVEWHGSKTPRSRPLKSRQTITPIQPRKPKTTDEMKDSVMAFSVGTNGALSLKKDKETLASNSATKGKVLVEELPSRLIHHCIPSVDGIAFTKKEQYDQLRSFEENVLKKSQLLEKKILSGVATVEPHEHNLQLELKELNEIGAGAGTNLIKLQTYANTFHDLAEDANIFGHLFRTIKEEYDSYLQWLLETHTTRIPILQQQMRNLEERETSRPSRLKEEEDRVKNLEDKAEKILEENENLRAELRKEELLLCQLENTEPVKATTKFIPKTSSEQVESLRVSIWEKIDDIENIRKDLNSNYVPISVCTYLEQCLKDTEVCIIVNFIIA
ncbi:DgyrCDS8376 [Dimorphilus gyrociliatus]|uniref:DgyrCDS8376 n=1 Tax=Dimorphilus gyrociliatus TaxID=2664684 RepID=A0A7I8VVI8_9ANNE|nr:DgyrCDS8376 [Dimorphilus gyrociliatus]